MVQGLFSDNWYRVAELAPRLRGHVTVHHQRYRATRWHILEDRQNNRFHRLSEAAWFVVAKLDGTRTLRAVWELAEARFGADVPAQDDLIRLLAQLHAADLLVSAGLPDLAELARRSQRQARAEMMGRVKNPLALRLPLLDPDRFLTATAPLVRWLFSGPNLLLWLGLVGAGLAVAVLEWPALSANAGDRMLSAQNILLLLLLYPAIKTVHELSHAYAVKRWGGEVREIGLMLLVLLPLPYVDASASLGFRDWWQRLVVGAAGIMAELGLAAVAVILWSLAEPGLVRAALFNIAVIGGVSTLLFNGNPLLRFDGYYVLCDLIGIPNLATRGNRYLGYLAQRYAFGLEAAESPVVTPSERPWLAGYAVAAFAYRLVIAAAISLFVAGQFFFVGVILALFALWSMVVGPVFKGLSYLLFSPALSRQRPRALSVSGSVAALLGLLVLAVPLPGAVVARGVVMVPPGSEVRSDSVGVIDAVLATAGVPVEAGARLLQLANPRLAADIERQHAFIAELQARDTQAFATDPAGANILRVERARAEAELVALTERQAALTVRAPRAGVWHVAAPQDLIGRHVGRGWPLGHVIPEGAPHLRAVVRQSVVDQVRRGERLVAVRLAHAPARSIAAEVVREVPEAGRVLPSPALAAPAGGPFAVDPEPQPDGLPRTLDAVFQFDLRPLPDQPVTFRAGERFHVRFRTPPQTLAARGYRALRQVFLRHFDV